MSIKSGMMSIKSGMVSIKSGMMSIKSGMMPKLPKMGRISVRQGGAARLCGFVAARHASFAVGTQRRLGSRGAKALPCRSVDGEGQRCARHGPQRAP